MESLFLPGMGVFELITAVERDRGITFPLVTEHFGLQTGDLHGITHDSLHWFYPPLGG